MTRISYSEMADEFQKLLYGKICWLADFSQGRLKRPDHEIERVQRERQVLEQARDDYARSAERKGEAA